MSDKIDDGGPAFPRPVSEDRTQGDQTDGNTTVGEQDGMTLRDYFAAKAMQGVLANPTWNLAGLTLQGIDENAIFRTAALMALAYADAMLKARKEQR